MRAGTAPKSAIALVGPESRESSCGVAALGVEVLHDESGAVKQFVERDDLRTMSMATVVLERSILLDVDAAV
jgi:hypothetical protein